MTDGSIIIYILIPAFIFACFFIYRAFFGKREEEKCNFPKFLSKSCDISGGRFETTAKIRDDLTASWENEVDTTGYLDEEFYLNMHKAIRDQFKRLGYEDVETKFHRTSTETTVVEEH